MNTSEEVNDNIKYPITNIVKECQLFNDIPDKNALEKRKTIRICK